MPSAFPHIRTLVAVTVATLTCVLAPAGSALAVESTGSDSVGFGVAPLRFDVDATAGASTSHVITLTNTDSSATKFTFSKEDFSGDRDDPGATPLLLGGKFESAISGYDWLTLPDPVTVPAGGTEQVTVKVSAPAGATGGHYVMLFVNGDSRRAGQIIASSRIGVAFMINAGGVPPPEIVITEIQEVGPDRTITRFVNNGSQATTDNEGTLTRDPVGPGETVRIPGTCTKEVLPGAAGQCEFTTPSGGGEGGSDDAGLLPVGPVEQYVDIVGDPGEEGTSARGELPTEWAGTWTSMLLPLVGVALFILYFLFLRRRRKDGGEGDDQLAWSGPTAS